ncbi:hypothetical protein ACWGH3_20285 [Streptomyces sp. NPDC054884]
MGAIATAVYGALGTGPRGEAVEITHTWEDVEARLGLLILTAAVALDDLTGDAWDTVDERLYGRDRTAVRSLPCHPLRCARTRPGPVRPASPVGDEWETSGR